MRDILIKNKNIIIFIERIIINKLIIVTKEINLYIALIHF